MPFFPQLYASPEAQFFRLLQELDQPQQKTCAPRQARPQTYTPRFDVSEVADAYELYGELPGVEQKDISIEFTDAQTIVIKGKAERGQTAVPVAETTATESTEAAETASEKSHNPTVEDDYDVADTPLATPATTATAAEDNTPAPQQEQTEAPKVPQPKLWVAERKVGSFARSFSFAQRIEQDGVQASLKNGVLRVVVPKSQKPKTVAVSVF